MTYKTFTNDNGIDFIIQEHEDNSTSWIPVDTNNSDYQAYLKWLENPEAESTQPTL